MGMYGNNVTISMFRMEGQAPDGTFRPGDGVECMVSFDPVGAGCTSDGYCSPGADIVWRVNGVVMQDTTWSANDPSLGGGYIATYRTVAPSSGSMTVTAQSANTVDFNIVVSSIDTTAGVVAISNLTCYNAGASSEAVPCTCGEAGTAGQVTIWFSATPISVGNGTAYYDVFVDGQPVITNATTDIHTIGEITNDSINVPCPSANATISIRGKTGIGSSVVYGGTAVQPTLTCDDSNTQCVNGTLMSWCVTESGTGGYMDNGLGSCSIPSVCDDTRTQCIGGKTLSWCVTNGVGGYADNGLGACGSTTSTDWITSLIDQATTFYNANKTVSILGIALLGGLILFSGKKQ